MEEPLLNFSRLPLPASLSGAATALAVHGRGPFVFVGSAGGAIHALDLAGREWRPRMQPHRGGGEGRVNAVVVDETGEWVGSASDDGSAAACATFSDEALSYAQHRAVRCVALAPDFARNRERPIVAGGLGGRLRLVRRGWLLLGSTTERVLHEGEGPVRACCWAPGGGLVAWANDAGVKLLDVDSGEALLFVPAPRDAPPPELCPPRLVWEGETTLLVAWADTVRVVVVRERDFVTGEAAALAPPGEGDDSSRAGGGAAGAGNEGSGAGERVGGGGGGGGDDDDYGSLNVLPFVRRRVAEIALRLFIDDAYVCGIAPFGPDGLALLCFEPGAAEGVDLPTVDLRIVSREAAAAMSTAETVSAAPSPMLFAAALPAFAGTPLSLPSAAASLSAASSPPAGEPPCMPLSRDRLALRGLSPQSLPADLSMASDARGIVGQDALPLLFVLAPGDLVCAQPRGVADHAAWQAARGDLREALAVAAAHPAMLPAARVREWTERYLRGLLASGRPALAATALARLLGNDEASWEMWARALLGDEAAAASLAAGAADATVAEDRGASAAFFAAPLCDAAGRDALLDVLPLPPGVEWARPGAAGSANAAAAAAVAATAAADAAVAEAAAAEAEFAAAGGNGEEGVEAEGDGDESDESGGGGDGSDFPGSADGRRDAARLSLRAAARAALQARDLAREEAVAAAQPPPRPCFFLAEATYELALAHLLRSNGAAFASAVRAWHAPRGMRQRAAEAAAAAAAGSAAAASARGSGAVAAAAAAFAALGRVGAGGRLLLNPQALVDRAVKLARRQARRLGGAAGAAAGGVGISLSWGDGNGERGDGTEGGEVEGGADAPQLLDVDEDEGEGEGENEGEEEGGISGSARGREPLFRVAPVLAAAQAAVAAAQRSEKERGPASQLPHLLDGLAELLALDGQHDKALKIYLDVLGAGAGSGGGGGRVFGLVREHGLYALVADKAAALIALDEAAALHLFAEHPAHFPWAGVAAQLEAPEDARALHAFLHHLFTTRRALYDTPPHARLHALQLPLYARFGAPGELLTFLKGSSHYPLEVARRLCLEGGVAPAPSAAPSGAGARTPLYRELVYVLGRMGAAREALALLMDAPLRDVAGAVAFVASLEDDALWGELVGRAIASNSGAVIAQLLDALPSTPLNALRVIPAIPAHLPIPHLPERLLAILRDRRLQRQAIAVCAGMVQRDQFGLVERLHRARLAGLGVDAHADKCALCGVALVEREHLKTEEPAAAAAEAEGGGDNGEGADSEDAAAVAAVAAAAIEPSLVVFNCAARHRMHDACVLRHLQQQLQQQQQAPPGGGAGRAAPGAPSGGRSSRTASVSDNPAGLGRAVLSGGWAASRGAAANAGFGPPGTSMRKSSGAGDARASAAAAAAAMAQSFTGHDDGRDVGRRRSSSAGRFSGERDREHSGERERALSLALSSGSERGSGAAVVIDGVDPRLRRSCPLCAGARKKAT